MKVTWNWLAEFVDMAWPVDRLAERLTASGFEVEAIESGGRELADVLSGEIVRVQPHPSAERLNVCDVRIGADAVAVVVCGATNMRAGDRIAYAPPGARLPPGRTIAVADVRGVTSTGMLCSEAELGLGADAAGLLILPAETAVGDRLSAVLGLEDTVLEIAITPNRGDCMSVLGLAREIAALTGQRLHRQRIAVRDAAPPAAELVSVRIADPDLCGRYVARVIANLSVAPAPLWMQARLQAVGLRPINNVVDITNYVMLERGQPLHAFDYDRLPRRDIVVRRAGGSAELTTLDGQSRRLDPDDLLIASGDDPVAIAGVMGGAATEVTAGTRRVLLESAWFQPSSVRRTARRLGVRSEASYRFERRTDIDAVPQAADRAAALLAQLAGGTVAQGRVDVYPSAYQAAPIALRLKRVDALLGMTLGRTEVVARLKALGMTVAPATRGALTVVPPSYRSDLTREIDLIEEIVRLIGYDRVPESQPESRLSGPGMAPPQRHVRELRRLLQASGLSEAVCVSFCSPRDNALFSGLGARRTAVTVRNPMSQDEVEMRLSLCSGLTRVVRENRSQGVMNVAAFSVGKVFWRDRGFSEGQRLAGVICRNLPTAGCGARDTAADFVDAKGIVESALEYTRMGTVHWLPAPDLCAFHPGKAARVQCDGTELGIVGALHPAIAEELQVQDPCWLFELDLDRLLQYGPRALVFADLPRFPAVVRDLAVVTNEDFASDQVIRFVRAWGKAGPLIEDVQLFDQYSGPPIPAGKKSLAYSIFYRATDRTLTDAEVNSVHSELIAALKTSLPVETR